MAIQLNQIFLGHTPSDQRRYLTFLLKHLREKYPNIVIPAVGQFTLAKRALEAGYKPENIQTSDVSLFSSLLGYYFSGQDIDTLDFEVADPFKEKYESYKTTEGKISYVFYLMKLAQLNGINYLAEIYNDMVENADEYVAQFQKQLAEYNAIYHGINYKIEDLRNEICERSDDTIMILNPPVFPKGYAKMFDFTGYLSFNIGIEEFNWKQEYEHLYDRSKALSYPTIWYRYRSVEGFNKEEVIYAKEYKVGKVDYWLITKPKALAGLPSIGYIDSFNRRALKPYPAPTFGVNDRMTENSKIQFVKVGAEQGLYYRDLFAHRLGNTKAEVYFLMLVDGKVFSTVGFHLGDLLRMKTTFAFENFGFSVYVPHYPHTNRLLMLMITCREMGEVLKRSMSQQNRVYDLQGIRTTCLSKYRTIKTHRGILERTHREMLPNGMYKIQAEGKFHPHSFKETLAMFLEEEKGFESYSQLEDKQ